MKTINDPIYLATFLLQIGGPLNTAIYVYAKKLGIEPWKLDGRARHGHFSGHEDHKGGVIWLKDKKDTVTLAHEAFHATAHVLSRMDIKLNDDTEEVYAYYLGWLIGEILK